MLFYKKTYHDFYMDVLNFQPKNVIKLPLTLDVKLRRHLDRTLISGKRYIYVHHHRYPTRKTAIERYAKNKPEFKIINTHDGKGIVIWRQP